MGDKIFSFLGKLFISIIVLGSMAYTGYYLGSKRSKVKIPAQVTSPEPTMNQILQTATPLPYLKFSGGVAKTANLSYIQYTIEYPSTWEIKVENQTPMDQKLTLSNGDYSISIFQAATGGALCLYDKDPDFEGPSSRFKYYKELATQDGRILRRSGDINGNAFTICQKGQDGSFQQPTNYGHISIKTPVVQSNEKIEEIDKILASLTKI